MRNPESRSVLSFLAQCIIQSFACREFRFPSRSISRGAVDKRETQQAPSSAPPALGHCQTIPRFRLVKIPRSESRRSTRIRFTTRCFESATGFTVAPLLAQRRRSEFLHVKMHGPLHTPASLQEPSRIHDRHIIVCHSRSILAYLDASAPSVSLYWPTQQYRGITPTGTTSLHIEAKASPKPGPSIPPQAACACRLQVV